MKVYIGTFDEVPVAASLDRDSAISALKQKVLEWYNDKLVGATLACNIGINRKYRSQILLLYCDSYEEITGEKVGELHDYANGNPNVFCDDFWSYETEYDFRGYFCMKHRVLNSHEPHIAWKLYELELLPGDECGNPEDYIHNKMKRKNGRSEMK